MVSKKKSWGSVPVKVIEYRFRKEKFVDLENLESEIQDDGTVIYVNFNKNTRVFLIKILVFSVTGKNTEIYIVFLDSTIHFCFYLYIHFFSLRKHVK